MVKTNQFSKITRSQEWWENKLPGMLGIAYATSIIIGVPLASVVTWISVLLFSIIAGAIYVSTINDLTDIQDDLRSGKRNRMAKIPQNYRWVIPVLCLVFGLIFVNILSPDLISATLYILPWIAFSLYSFEPFRLKRRGIWGVIADASGAHLFVSLLMVSSVTYHAGKSIDLEWFGLIAIWSLFFGIRGILWHQYYDRDNDLKSNTDTFATRTPPGKFKKNESLLFVIELVVFTAVLVKLSLPINAVLAILYILLVLLRFKAMGHKPVMILNPNNSPLQILMLDFYQVFFPLGLLIHIAFTQNSGWVVLLIHLILFPRKLLNIFIDIRIIMTLSVKKFQSLL